MIILGPSGCGKSHAAKMSDDVFVDGDLFTSPTLSHAKPWWIDQDGTNPLEQNRRTQRLIAAQISNPGKHILSDMNPNFVVPEAKKRGIQVIVWIPPLKKHFECARSRIEKQAKEKRGLSTMHIRLARARMQHSAANLGTPIIRSLDEVIDIARNMSVRKPGQVKPFNVPTVKPLEYKHPRLEKLKAKKRINIHVSAQR